MVTFGNSIFRVFWCEQCERPILVCPFCASTSCSSDSCPECVGKHMEFEAKKSDYPWELFRPEDIYGKKEHGN